MRKSQVINYTLGITKAACRALRAGRCSLRAIMVIIVAGMVVVGCSRPVPLNKKKFSRLLTDVHMADGILSQAKDIRYQDQGNYMYYNDIFQKYGVTRNDFDSMLRYYSGQRDFYKMYEKIIDTLSRRESQKQLILQMLTRNDTVNLFRGYYMARRDTLHWDILTDEHIVLDTVYLESVRHGYLMKDTARIDDLNPYVLVEVKGITPGYYEFNARMRFDTLDVAGRRDRIRADFISSEGDTLHVRDYIVQGNRLTVNPTWQYYVADSAYNRLVIKIMEQDTSSVYSTGRRGRVWDTRIYKKYASEMQRETLLEQQKRERERP